MIWDVYFLQEILWTARYLPVGWTAQLSTSMNSAYRHLLLLETYMSELAHGILAPEHAYRIAKKAQPHLPLNRQRPSIMLLR